MRNLCVVFLAILVVITAAPAPADFNVGQQARFIAMGGAGLAAVDEPSVTSSINPAALGVMRKGLRFQFPSLSMKTEGASLSDIEEWAGDIFNLTGPEGIALAREFGRRETILDVNVTTGLVGAPMSLTADGDARVRIIPNDAFRQFAETGVPSQDMAALIWGEAAIVLPSVGLGFRAPSVSPGRGDLWMGARLRYVKGKYVQRTISWSGSLDPNDLLTTSNEPIVDESGVGADVGLLYRKAGPKDVSCGLVVTNLVKPSLGNIRQDAIWSMGFATKVNSRTLIVADLVNLTKSYNESARLRIGCEVKPISALALRAGYSGGGLTTGIGLFGIDVAFGSDLPLTLSRTIRF